MPKRKRNKATGSSKQTANRISVGDVDALAAAREYADAKVAKLRRTVPRRNGKNTLRNNNAPGEKLYKTLDERCQQSRNRRSTQEDIFTVLSFCCKNPSLQKPLLEKLKADNHSSLDMDFDTSLQLEILQSVMPSFQQTVHCHPATTDALVHSSESIFVLNVVLNRVSKNRGKMSSDLLTEQIFYKRGNKQQRQDNKASDELFRTTIVLFPAAGVFLTVAFKLLDSADLVFLPMSWLRLKEEDGWPASGAFIRSIQQVWAIHHTEFFVGPRMLACCQKHDEEVGSPLVPPDRGPGMGCWDKVEDRREAYRAMTIVRNATYRHDCRRYLKGTLHDILPSGVYHYDPQDGGGLVLSVTVNNMNGFPSQQSRIHICMVNDHPQFLSALETTAREAHKLPDNVVGNTRTEDGTGDRGTMAGIGRFVAHDGKTLNNTVIARNPRHAAFSGTLANLSEQAANFANDKFPGLVATARWHAEVAKIPVPDYLGKASKAFSPQMAMSRNLMNASHFDPRDGSPGMCVYALADPNSGVRNWRFLYPNIEVSEGGQTYHGLCINMSHGMAMLFDGRVIRHCTTVHSLDDKDGNSTFGFWFGLNGRAFRWALEHPDLFE